MYWVDEMLEILDVMGRLNVRCVDVLLIQLLASLALYDTIRVSHLATNLREEFIPACP